MPSGAASRVSPPQYAKYQCQNIAAHVSAGVSVHTRTQNIYAAVDATVLAGVDIYGYIFILYIF